MRTVEFRIKVAKRMPNWDRPSFRSQKFGMPKRLHSEATTSDEDDDYSIVAASDEEDVDISSALTGKKRPKLSNDRESGDEDQALHEIIRQATSKRDVKGGTEILKKTKGKTKFTKGEIGGGSFQSMGTGSTIKNSTFTHNLFIRSTPMAPSLFDLARLSHTDSDPAAVRPYASQ